jgi:hypothetical protein
MNKSMKERGSLVNRVPSEVFFPTKATVFHGGEREKKFDFFGGRGYLKGGCLSQVEN